MKLKVLIKRGIFAIKKALPVICSVAASLGVILTAYFSAKESPKAKEAVEANHSVTAVRWYKKIFEKVKYGWKYFIKTIVCAALTIMLIVISCMMSRSQLAAMAATLGYVTANRDHIESEIKRRYGDDVLKDIKNSTPYDYVMCTAGPSVEETGRGDLLCFERYSGRWFRSSEVAVRKAIKDYKKLYEDWHTLSYNDFYSLLGIAHTDFGFAYGYPANPDYFDGPLEIEAEVLEGWTPPGCNYPINEEVLVIDVYTFPVPCWYELH